MQTETTFQDLVSQLDSSAVAFDTDNPVNPELGAALRDTLADADIYAANTLDDQERVGVSPNGTAAVADGRLTVELPPVSWTAISLG